MDTSSAENLKRVAQKLVQAREAKGISLEEIATKTFIPMRILKALEAGETFKLPEPIFVQGFVKRYAKLVGLDGDTLATEIPLNTQPVAVDLIKEVPRPPLVDVINKRVTPNSEPTASSRSLVNPVQSQRSVNLASETLSNGGSETAAKPTAPVFNPPVVTSDTPNFYGSQSNSSGRPSWLWPAIGGAVLGFGFLMGAIALIKGTQTAQPPKPTPSVAPVTQSSSPKPSPVASPSVSPLASAIPSPSASPIASASPSPSPNASPSASPSPNAAGPVNLAVSLNEASWVQVTVDGEVKFEGTLEKGAKRNWAGQKEVEISSGNAGAVMLVHNQTPAKPMGAAGQVVTKSFSAKN